MRIAGYASVFDVADAGRDTVRVPGLYRRRAAERALCLSNEGPARSLAPAPA